MLQKHHRRHRVAKAASPNGLTLPEDFSSPPIVITQQQLETAAAEPLMNSEDEDEDKAAAEAAEPAAAGAPLRTKTADWRSALGTRVMLELEAQVPLPGKKNKRSSVQRGTGLRGELTATQIRTLLHNTALHWALDLEWLHATLADLEPTQATAPVKVQQLQVSMSSASAATAASSTPTQVSQPGHTPCKSLSFRGRHRLALWTVLSVAIDPLCAFVFDCSCSSQRRYQPLLRHQEQPQHLSAH